MSLNNRNVDITGLLSALFPVSNGFRLVVPRTCLTGVLIAASLTGLDMSLGANGFLLALLEVDSRPARLLDVDVDEEAEATAAAREM